MTTRERINELLKQYRPIFGDADSIAIAKALKNMNIISERVTRHDKEVAALSNAVKRKNKDRSALELAERSVEFQLERAINK